MRMWLMAVAAFPAVGLAAGLVIPPEDVGDARQFAEVPAQLQLTNETASPIDIAGIVPVRKGDSVGAYPRQVPAAGSISVPVRINTGNDLGIHLHAFGIKTNEPGLAGYFAQVKVFSTSMLDDPMPKIDFGMVAADRPSDAVSVGIGSRESDDLRVERVIESPDFVDVAIAADHRGVQLRPKQSSTWGLHAGYVKLGLNEASQPQAWIEVRADIRGDVVPDANPFGFGVARQGQKNEFSIRLSNPAGKDFRAGAVTLEGFKGDAKVVPCVPAKAGCRLLKFSVADDQDTGKLAGLIKLNLPASKATLGVNVWGLLLKAETKVIALDDEINKRAEIPQGATSAAVVPRISDALKRQPETSKTSTETEPDGTGPLLRWTVANEQELYGYAIYRSERADGRFKRVSANLIRANSDLDGPGKYRWRDRSADTGKSYWYQIMMVYLDGRMKALSEPREFQAK